MKTGHEAKQKSSHRSPCEASHSPQDSPSDLSPLPKRQGPHPSKHVEYSEEFFPSLKLQPKGYPTFPTLNFPLQQFCFCLLRKGDSITFYWAFYNCKPLQQKAAFPQNCFCSCSEQQAPRAAFPCDSTSPKLLRPRVSTCPRTGPLTGE